MDYENYEINKDTLAILPLGENNSKVMETEAEYNLNVPSFSVIEHSCSYFGSSYKGRHEGTKELLGITHKAPIVIEESSKMIFFPTASPINGDCIWLSLDNISKYYKSINPKCSIIEFKNGFKVELAVSIGSLSNQILRATRLRVVLEDRINKKALKTLE